MRRSPCHPRSPGPPAKAFLILSACLVTATGCDAGSPLGQGLGPLAAALLLLTAALRTVAGDLPLQNQFALLVLLSGTRTGFLWIESLRSGVDLFGMPRVLTQVTGSVATLVLARGVARRGLRSIRTSPRFGYWLLGTATVLGGVADQLLSRCLTGVSPTPAAVSLVWSAAGLVAGLPWFLSKRPVPESVDRRPLVLWSLAMVGIGVLLELQGKPSPGAFAGALAVAAWLPECLRRGPVTV